MGACASIDIDIKEQQEQHIETTSTENRLKKAKKVIDDLNIHIGTLEKELASLRRQISKQHQKKNEESDKLHRAQQRINKIETEKDELNDKLMRISIINSKSISDEDKARHNALEKDDSVSVFGEAQSPINIITISPPHNDHNEKTVVVRNEDFNNNGLKFNYPEKVSNCTIINNGHTVQINIPSTSCCRLSIYDKEYDLKQFHFHTPSEHTIDNKQYEMEMHLVHINKDNGICVLGFIFTSSQSYQRPKLQLTKSRAHLIKNNNNNNNTECDDEESDDLETDDEWDDDEEQQINKNNIGNDFLNQFWDELPSKKTEKEILLKKALSFDYLFETSANNITKNIKTNEIEINMEIFEYMGSLTTPPYTEGVQWLVSKTTHFINDKQLSTLSGCWNNENNARSVQKYFGRQVSLRSKSSLRVIA